jgi:glutathione synthase
MARRAKQTMPKAHRRYSTTQPAEVHAVSTLTNTCEAASKLGFVMDRIPAIRCLEDTTFSLMKEAQVRGHRLFHLEPEDISLDSRKGLRLELKEVAVSPLTGITVIRKLTDKPLSFLNALLLRKDPPFDLAYYHHLLLLAACEDEIFMMNRPSSLILGNEKLLPLYFPGTAPATLISAREDRIRDFSKHHSASVWKPFSERSGRGISKIPAGGSLKRTEKWGLAQVFLPQIKTKGDKRVFLLDGKVIGTYLRFPPKGQWLIQPEKEDGRLSQTSLSQKEKRMLARIGSWLRTRGLYFAGVDMIGQKVTEINVTSPGGLAEAALFYPNTSLPGKVIDFLERKI